MFKKSKAENQKYSNTNSVEVEESRLKELIFMRFVEGISEEDLLKEIKSPLEKELFSAISLRDLNRAEMIESLACSEPVVFRRVLECRERIKKILNDFAHESLARRNDASLFAHGNFNF